MIDNVFLDNGDGSADVDYIPTAEGEYAVHILCDKEDIPGSPYMAQILPQTDFDPDKVKAFGPGLENGVNPKESTHFTIDTTEAGEAPLEVAIVDDLGEYKPEIKKKTEKVFECTYTPRNGQHKVRLFKAIKSILYIYYIRFLSFVFKTLDRWDPWIFQNGSL